MKSLRIGCVKYLNARPLIRGWDRSICLENPAVLCRKLAAGELDVALVSSFEFLRNPVYRIVDAVSISSDGPVHSVVVAHRENISEIEEIELDPASETSVALLRCLLAQRGLNPRLVARDEWEKRGQLAACAPQTSRSKSPRDAQLLIGDQAIRFRQKFGETYEYWDLGNEWRGVTKLPFVYALWLLRPEVLNPQAIADRLRVLRNENLANLDQLIAAEKDFDHEFCKAYYRKHLRFSFGEKEKEGLRLFQRLCVRHGILPQGEIGFVLV